MTNTSLTIIALAEGATAAELLSAHRSATLNVVDTVSEIGRAIRASSGPVLLSLDDKIQVRELSEIMITAHNADVPCGFIDSWRGPESSIRHARNILAWSPRQEPGISFWNSEHTTTGYPGTYSNLHIVKHDEEFPAEILSDARRTLGMITHGNGADAPFGQGFLCGRMNLPDAVQLDNYFPCGLGGRCIRGKFIGGEFKDPRRYPTSDLGGDVIVWGTCYNALAADSIFDPRGGLLAGLLEKATGNRTRPVITLVRAAAADEIAMLAACARIEAGETLGSVVTGLNEAYLKSAPNGTYPPWILFGDPTSRIESDHSVGWSSDGEEIRPGLSLFQLPGGSKDTEAVLLVKDPAGASADLWFRQVEKGPEGLLLRRDTGSPIRVTSTIPEAGELIFFRRRLASAESLTFSDMLFRLVAGNPVATSFRYDLPVARRIQEMLQYMNALHLSPHPYHSISGDSGDFVKLLTAEKGNWKEMNKDLFLSLIQVLRDFGGDIYHHHDFVPPSLADSVTLECPYCGSPAELSVTRFRGPIAARSNLRCGRCAIISDSDEAYGPVLLSGPDTITAGQGAEYSLQLEAAPEHGVEFGCAQLFMRRPPGPFADFGPLAMIEGAASTLVFDLHWTPSADAEPGRYYLIAAIVVDGAILAGKRPVLIKAAANAPL